MVDVKSGLLAELRQPTILAPIPGADYDLCMQSG